MKIIGGREREKREQRRKHMQEDDVRASWTRMRKRWERERKMRETTKGERKRGETTKRRKMPGRNREDREGEREKQRERKREDGGEAKRGSERDDKWQGT